MTHGKFDKELSRAVLLRMTDKARQALVNGANPNSTLVGSQTTLLHHAAGHGPAELVEALLQHGAAADPRDSSQATPLHWAATMGRADIAELLLKKGTGVNAQTADQNTPLHRAARHGRTAVARLLLQNGANRNATNAEGRTALDIAKQHLAEHDGNPELAQLLEETPPDNAVDPATTPTKRPRSGKRPQRGGRG